MSTRPMPYSTTSKTQQESASTSAAAATSHFRAATAALTPAQYRASLAKVKGPDWAEQLVAKVSTTTKRTQATLAERMKPGMSRIADLSAAPSVVKDSVPTATLDAVTKEWKDACRGWISVLQKDVESVSKTFMAEFRPLELPLSASPEMLDAAERLRMLHGEHIIYLNELASALLTVLEEVNK